MKPFIVMTSIFPPTEAVRSFARWRDHTLIVVGDRKTPPDWRCAGVEYLSVEHQQDLGLHLDRVLPYDHYSRKMMGYLHAIQRGADIIIDTDDDNLPRDNWGFPDLQGLFPTVPQHQGFINIYQWYTRQHIWPRGLPLRLVSRPFDPALALSPTTATLGVWQGLADEDPDVDAVYRLTSNVPCVFDQRAPIVLGRGTLCPFNSQNTLTRRELFPLLYLPAHVTFRFTDILRGLVAQPIMWLFGYHLGFTNATVVQKRNPHDYMRDFLSELPMYQHAERVVDLVAGVVSSGQSLLDNLFGAYEALERAHIVESRELEVLAAWLRDVEHTTPRPA